MSLSNEPIPDLLPLLQDLIRIDSVNPSLVPGARGEREIAHFVGEILARMGLTVAYQETQEGRPNVVGVLKGAGGGRSVLLNGHLDTVATAGMQMEPLNPLYRDGKVYGRGSADMKGGLASMIGAVQSIVEHGPRLQGDVIVAGVVDEEYASIGTEKLVQEYTADAGIVCEPSGMQLTIAHKGFVWATVNVTGKAVHGSRWQDGVDAIAQMGKVLVGIGDWNRQLVAGAQHPILGPASVHASLIKGGQELSTYPERCQMQLERRTIPGETRQSVVDELERMMGAWRAQDHEFRAELDVFFYRGPLEVSRDEPIVQAVARACEKTLQAPPAFGGSAGWMDSAIMADAGIPTVIFGPIGQGGHAVVEWVDLASVVSAAQVLRAAIVDFCGTV